MTRFLPLLFLLLAATACDSPSGPGGERYALVAVNGAAPPAAYPGFPWLEVVSGEITLRDDGTVQDVVVVRCAAAQSPGSSCQVENGGRRERDGTYSRDGGWVRFTGTEYPTTFTAGTVTIVFASVSMGLPPVVFEYRR